jgi:hypothetical protein
VENSALSQQSRTLLLWGGGLLLAILVGWTIGFANYQSLIIWTGIVAIAVVAFFSGRFFWVLTIGSSFLGGIFPFLGANFTPFQILVAIGVAKFLIEDVVLRRTRIKPANRFDMLMIVGFMAVLTVHAVHDRFGMRYLGSSVWGGRNYVNVYVGLAAFFVVQSIPMKPKVWAKLPYVILAVTSFDLLIGVITTIFPSSIYKIYPFYSAVSMLGIEEIVTGESDVTGRLGAFGNFGFILITLVLASVSLRHILNPSNLLRVIGLIIGSLTVLYSGYRSSVLNTLIGFVAAGIRDLKFAVVLLLPLLAIVLFGLSVVNSQFFHLPKQVQRGLAFLPGKWDAKMASDAAASNDFRMHVWSLWAHNYFPVHPWLGRGFGFQKEWTKTSVYNPTAADYRQMVEVGNIHNGFFGTLDTFGVVGAIFFILWNLGILVRSLRVSFRRDDPSGLALRFLALYLVVSILSFWIGALNVGSFLPQEFALVGVFLRLRQNLKSDFRRVVTSAPTPEQDLRAEVATA